MAPDAAPNATEEQPRWKQALLIHAFDTGTAGTDLTSPIAAGPAIRTRRSVSRCQRQPMERDDMVE